MTEIMFDTFSSKFMIYSDFTDLSRQSQKFLWLLIFIETLQNLKFFNNEIQRLTTARLPILGNFVFIQ